MKDNFGDLGIVGLFLVRVEENTAEIDSFVLSCRALGRGIEDVMMNQIKRDYLLSGRCGAVKAWYLPTAKNRPAADFYARQGFTLTTEADDGGKCYVLRRAEAVLQDCPGITLSCEEESDNG